MMIRNTVMRVWDSLVDNVDWAVLLVGGWFPQLVLVGYVLYTWHGVESVGLFETTGMEVLANWTLVFSVFLAGAAMGLERMTNFLWGRVIPPPNTGPWFSIGPFDMERSLGLWWALGTVVSYAIALLSVLFGDRPWWAIAYVGAITTTGIILWAWWRRKQPLPVNYSYSRARWMAVMALIAPTVITSVFCLVYQLFGPVELFPRSSYPEIGSMSWFFMVGTLVIVLWWGIMRLGSVGLPAEDRQDNFGILQRDGRPTEFCHFALGASVPGYLAAYAAADQAVRSGVEVPTWLICYLAAPLVVGVVLLFRYARMRLTGTRDTLFNPVGPPKDTRHPGMQLWL